MTETKSEIRPAADTHPAAGQTIRFRPDIDGLRAVAVMLVVAGDAGVPGVAGGRLGVDVFFVLSGFLITGLLLRELDRTGRLSLPRFLFHRTRRLLPAAVVVLVAVLGASYRWVGFLAPASLRQFWPLAVELTFYLVWPIVLIVLVWLGFRWALPYWVGAVVAGSMAYAIWLAPAMSAPGLLLGSSLSAPSSLPAPSSLLAHSPLAPASLLAHIPDISPLLLINFWPIGVGCLLALAVGRLERIPYRLATVASVVGVTVIAVSVLSFNPTRPVSPYAALPAVAGTVLVLAGRADSLLGVRPLQWLGRVSYPFALWHWPVLVIGPSVLDAPPVLLVLGSLGLAAITYVCVEIPIRRLNLSCG
jgi:peptidoglycan/LPS O-acetylase OafA/YrhL